MIIYLLLWIILLLCAVFYRHIHTTKNILYCFLFLLLLIIAGGRSIETGIDTLTYYDIYDTIKKQGYLPYLEPAWNALNMFSAQLSLSFNGMLTIAAFLTLTPIFYVIKKDSPNPYLSLFIYFSMHIYCAYFNIMRQYLALSWIFLAYSCLSRGNKSKAFLSLSIAFLFHYSSIITLLVIIISRFIKLKKGLWLWITPAIALFLGSFMQDSFFSIFAFGYEGYVSRGLYRETDSTMAFALAFIVSVFVLLIIGSTKNECLNSLWFRLLFLSIVVLNLTHRLEYGARIYAMLSISQIIAFPLYLQNNLLKNKNLASIIILMYMTLIFFRMLLTNANGICPYENVLIQTL